MFNEKVLAVDTTAEIALAAVNKVQAVVANVEANHVATKHALKDFVGPREQAENVPGWEGDVQEERQLELEILFFRQFAYVIGAQHEMVVMYPDNWDAGVRLARTSLQSLNGFFSEKFIDFHVRSPVVS